MVASLIAKSVIYLSSGTILVGGATLSYLWFKPTSLRDQLLANGEMELSSDKDYRAIIYDQPDLISDKFGNDKSKQTVDQLKSWCQSKRKAIVKDKGEEISQLCTKSGIHTIKGLLTVLGNREWVSEKKGDEQDSLYKDIVAVYKENLEFDMWLGINSDDKVSEKYTLLKRKCEEGLKMDYESVDSREIQHYDWWCKALPYKTLEQLLKAQNPNLEMKKKWEGIAQVWKNTPWVKMLVNGKENMDQTDDNKYQEWCAKYASKEVGSEDGLFPNIYDLFRSMCSNARDRQ